MGKYDDPKYDEKVLCVNADDLNRLWDRKFHRFHPDPARRYINSLLKGRSAFLARRDVEENPIWVQVIPYVILRHCGWLYTYKRLDGDTRLDGLISIGVGGHVNESDTAPLGIMDGGILRDCADRELAEEVAIPSEVERSTQWCGILYDPDDPADAQKIGCYHLGAVSIVDLSLPHCWINSDEGMTRGEWMSPMALREAFPTLEPWSRTLLKVYGYLPKYQGQKSKA